MLLITALGRSGSTLLERALGAVPGVTALGELVHLWERGARDHELCSCGKPFSRLPVLVRVGQVAFGGWDQLDADEVVALRHAVVRTRHLPALLARAPRPSWRLRRDHLGRIVGALSAASRRCRRRGCWSTPARCPPTRACCATPGWTCAASQVVRDPRGVAYSLGKTVQRPEVVDRSRRCTGSARPDRRCGGRPTRCCSAPSPRAAHR